MKIQVFDKVKWHYPDGNGCPDLQHALRHFKDLCRWLQKNSLLSSYGRDVVNAGIDSEFSITSEMLTEEGTRVLNSCYTQWLKGVEYGRSPDFRLLEKELSRKA
jgi:hypothetical protein